MNFKINDYINIVMLSKLDWSRLLNCNSRRRTASKTSFNWALDTLTGTRKRYVFHAYGKVFIQPSKLCCLYEKSTPILANILHCHPPLTKQQLALSLNTITPSLPSLFSLHSFYAYTLLSFRSQPSIISIHQSQNHRHARSSGYET